VKLSDELQLMSCPLCGHDYGSTDELLAHIDVTTSRPTDRVSSILELTRRLGETRSRLANNRQEIADQRELLGSVENETAILSKHIQTLSEEAAALARVDFEPPSEGAISTLRGLIRNHEELVAASEASLSDRQLEVEACEAEAFNAREEFATLRSRVDALTTEATPLSGANQLEELHRELEQAKQLHGSRDSQNAEAENEYQAKAAVYEQLSASVRDLRRSLEEARARLAENRQRFASLEQQLRERTAQLSLNSDMNQLTAAIADRLAAIYAKEKDLGAAMNDLEGIVSADRYEIAATEIKQLQAKESEAEKEVQLISRAEKRFARIAEVTRERSRSEAEKAIEIFRDAIQECFRALNPHRHLDEIKLSASEILVTDADLADAVQPYLYTSTGQLNVLALSVFIGVALRQRISNLNFVMLDEPVQNLADLQFLAFLSFVKRVALGRQVILSTADSNIAELFRRQMASSAWSRQKGRYVHYEWHGFDSKSGPQIERLDTSAGPSRRRRVRTAL
jgi:predicted  nucleic acid-binding Zn-ribbon protein